MHHLGSLLVNFLVVEGLRWHAIMHRRWLLIMGKVNAAETIPRLCWWTSISLVNLLLPVNLLLLPVNLLLLLVNLLLLLVSLILLLLLVNLLLLLVSFDSHFLFEKVFYLHNFRRRKLLVSKLKNMELLLVTLVH